MLSFLYWKINQCGGSMFARIKRNSGTRRCSVLVCHNVRIDGKVKQFTIKTFGHSADPEQLAVWMEQATFWIAHYRQRCLTDSASTQRQAMRQPVLLQNLTECARINVGMMDVFGPFYEQLGFSTVFTGREQETLRQVIFSRLLEPGSKRRLSVLSKTAFDIDLPVDRIYRMMDKLLERRVEVEKRVFSGTSLALDGKVNVVLFDVTTLSFETVSEDTLRAFGYSKDFKFNTTQVVLALATTAEGLPVGYRLFRGNTAECKTLIESIHHWREYLPIDSVTVVGDRAMMTSDNLSALESAGFHYVVAYPLRKLSREVQAQVLDRAGYHTLESDDDMTAYRVVSLGERRLVVSYSAKRAAKDAKDRERLIKKLEKKLSTCKQVKRLMNNNGYLKYVDIAGKASAHIDQEKIDYDAQWDGLHGVITNKVDIDHRIYQTYRRLWVIEESFRINKHNLKMRPIYHYTPKRIEAHILLCYMVFALIRHVQFKLTQAGQPMGVQRITDALCQVQASILKDTSDNQQYRLPSKMTKDAKIIYSIFNIKQQLAPCQWG